MKRKLLFVDGEAGALRELHDELAASSSTWELLYCKSGLVALNALQAQPCEAVVTELRLSDMSGEQLLEHVARAHPQTHRIVLADLGDVQALLHCVGNVNQFLILPCEVDRLQIVLERALTFQLWLPNQTVRDLLGRLPQLPSPEESYGRVVQELQSPNADLATVAELIAQDPAMAARVLQLANSAAYGLPTEDADPRAAVCELGLANVRSLLLLAHTYSNFSKAAGAGFSVSELWRHSQATARLAAALARADGADAAAATQAATAGLLHDLGKLALAVNLPDHWRRVVELVKAGALPSWQAEQQVFGTTHGEVGGWLLGVWGLPVSIVEAVALHHHPARFLSPGFCPLTAVHVADAFLHADTLEAAQSRLDAEYLRAIGVEEKLTQWWALARDAQK